MSWGLTNQLRMCIPEPYDLLGLHFAHLPIIFARLSRGENPISANWISRVNLNTDSSHSPHQSLALDISGDRVTVSDYTVSEIVIERNTNYSRSGRLRLPQESNSLKSGLTRDPSFSGRPTIGGIGIIILVIQPNQRNVHLEHYTRDVDPRI